MLRLIATLLALFLLAGFIAWLAVQPGEVVILWRGTRIAMGAATAFVLGALALTLAIVVPLGIARLARTPHRLRLSRAERRRRRGLDRISAGMIAVAAGDQEAARRDAKAARDLLGEAPLVLLLSAQAEQLSGDEQAAGRLFRAMLDRPDTEFLGTRGLISLALRRGDRNEAMELLDRARILRPKSPWVLNTLFELACGGGDWMRAGAVLDEMKAARSLPEPELRRRRVVLLSAAAEHAEAAGELAEAQALARRANKLDPGFAPAAIVLARRLAATGNARSAASLLEQSWTAAPNPALAPTYWALEPDEPAAQRLARTRRLVGGAPEARESRMVLAEQALAAHDRAAAREALVPLAADPTVHVCVLNAALAHEEGNEAAAQDWLVRCTRAGRDPTWLCAGCGSESPVWHPVCPACGQFDSLRWLAPPELAGPRGMLSAPPLEPAPAAQPGSVGSQPHVSAEPLQPALAHPTPDDPGLDEPDFEELSRNVPRRAVPNA